MRVFKDVGLVEQLGTVSGGKGDKDPPHPGGGVAIDSGGDGGKRGAGKVDEVRGRREDGS